MKQGVNLVGFLEAESGLGEIARKLARAIQHAGIPIAAIPYRGTASRLQAQVGLPLADEAPYDTNVLCMNAHQLLEFATDVGSDLFARRYSVGVWFWETTVVRSEDHAATRFLDEIWVASEYVRDAVETEAGLPIRVVPIPVEPPRGPFLSRAELGLPERFTYLFLFDHISSERKNPEAVVKAFTAAFEPGEGPALVLKSVNGREREPARLAALQALAAEHEGIVVRDGYVSAMERDSYIAMCDCYVSLHRSEGFGLTMAEAMAHGKPVIATAHSGNLEFMTDKNSYLVPGPLVPVPQGWWGHAPGAQWAEPDVDAAAELMRRVWEHSAAAHALGEHARKDILQRCSLARAAEFIEGRVSSPRARRILDIRAVRDPRPAILDASLTLAKDPAQTLAARGRGGLARKLLARALWPYLSEERRVNNALIDALITLQRSVEDTGRTLPIPRDDGDDAPLGQRGGPCARGLDPLDADDADSG